MFKKVGGFFRNNWYKLVFGFVFLSVFSALYLFRLGSFVRGDSIYETPKYLAINGVDIIFQHISMAPIKVLELAMLKIDEPNSTLLRLVSVFILGISFVVFYRLILKWQTHRIAILSTLLLASSTFSLNLGRFTLQDAMYYLMIPSLLLMGTWLRSKKYVKRVLYALPATAILLYLPGFSLILIITLVVFRRRLLAAWRFCDTRFRLIGSSVGILLLAPAVYALIKYPSQIYEFFGIDRIANGNINSLITRLTDIPKELFYSGINEPYRWLYGTPIIDIVTLVFFILGFYAFIKSQHTLRARLLFSLLIICIVIICLGNIATVALLIPLIYIYVSKGMAFMLQNWFTVFPRNPAARNLGAIMLFIPVFLSVGFNVQRYFTAWHNSPETVQALKIK